MRNREKKIKKEIKVASLLIVKFTQTISNLSAAAFWMQQEKGILGKSVTGSREIQFSWLLGKEENMALSTHGRATCIITSWGWVHRGKYRQNGKGIQKGCMRKQFLGKVNVKLSQMHEQVVTVTITDTITQLVGLSPSSQCLFLYQHDLTRQRPCGV